jgi:photosystem II stability/assembly factor-like uncharacterized protein
MLRLNIYAIVFLSFFRLEIIAQRTSEWEVLQSPTNDLLRKLYFVDSNNGWATGLSGDIIHTSDAGKSWSLQNSNVTSPVVDVFFINPTLGWALTYPDTPPFGTTLLKTTNGGTEWIKIESLFPQKFMTCIYFADDSTGWIGGSGIAKTTNGGVTWQNSYIDSGAFSTYPIYDLNFYNKDFGYACGGRIDVAGVIWKTTNGGESWSSIGLSPDQIFDIFIFDSLNAITLSGDPEMLFGVAKLRTSDAGETWQYEELPIFGIAYAIDFLNENEGYSSAGFQLLHTVDGGLSWEAEMVKDSLIIYDLQFVDQYTGFACGQDGALLKFTSFKMPTVDKPTFELMQNYPNPFSEMTTIRFTVLSQDNDVPTRVKIKLFDILGNEITTIVDEDFYWGFYERILNPVKQNLVLSSGVYILSIVSGDYFISKKMIYLK